ncbi:hypothetical protein ACVOMV_00110 [Mesorhizobium atlanticum]
MRKLLIATALIVVTTSVAAAQQLDLGGIGKADGTHRWPDPDVRPADRAFGGAGPRSSSVTSFTRFVIAFDRPARRHRPAVDARNPILISLSSCS